MRNPSVSCPRCGEAIQAEAPRGLCPKCLLAAVAAPTETGMAGDTRPAPPSVAEVAAAFPQLDIIEIVGQGGMGVVFKARQPKLDRFVALKLLPAMLAADAAFAERFTREGRVLARLNHPNIVAIHDFGQANGFFYLLMEFVDGVNLRQAMQAGRFTPEQALAVVPNVCEALQYAHNAGVLHRDIKPENIMLDAAGRVKIADFGIAKLAGDGTGERSLTGSGARLGTPHYMAPEQIERPGMVDHRADIYSLGVVFYEMLTGELPLGRFAPPSEKSTADPRLDDVVFRALAREPTQRPQSAGEVKTQVETIANSPKSASASPAPTFVDAQPRRALARWPLKVLASVGLALVVGVIIRLFFPQWFGPLADAAAPELPRVTPTVTTMRTLATRIAEGDQAALDELVAIRKNLYDGIDRTKEEARVRSNLVLMTAAFDVLGQQTGQGNEKAFAALQRALETKDLRSFAPHALGLAAAAGHRESLQMLLEHKRWGILLSSAASALQAPAERNNAEAVDFLINVLAEDKHRPLWRMAAQGLQAAAAAGNANARSALQSYAEAGQK